MGIKINIKELCQILDITPSEHNIMLVGRHGCGKSEILTNYYYNKGIKVVTLFLGQMSDPGDIIGLPRINEATGKTDFIPPYWFPTDGQPIVLFLDELNRARPEVLQTIMDLSLNRKLAGKSLPEGSRIISAVNNGEEYQVTELDPALVSRFNVYQFFPSTKEWLLWASKHGIDERIISFIQENPLYLDESKDIHVGQGLDKTPDRRGWERVSEYIKGVSAPTDLHKKIIAGIIGLNATSAFFLSCNTTNIVSAKELLTGYQSYRNTIMKYDLHKITMLHESIGRFFESEDLSLYDKKAIAQNLNNYFSDLNAEGNKEAMAHFVSLYTSGNYSKMGLFFLTKAPDLFQIIDQFIKEM